jgi:hypothetical protein
MHLNRTKIIPNLKLRIKPTNTNKNRNLRQKRRKYNIETKSKEHQVEGKFIRHIKRISIKESSVIDKQNYDNRKYKSLIKWKNLFLNQPAFILGNGLSISKQSLNLLDDYFTIGINRIFYIYEPTILFWQDRELWKSNQENILKSKSIRVCRDLSDPRKMFINFKLEPNEWKFKRKTDILYGRGNSGAIAVQFAIALGCNSIILIGMDCKYGKNGETDFYGKNKDHRSYTLKMCNAAMKWLKEKCPVPIYNCGNIDLWPKWKLKDVIEELKPEKYNRNYFKKLFSK